MRHTKAATLEPLDEEARGLLFEHVRPIVAGIPRSKRHLLALLISPETGVKLVTRGELSARLRDAGLTCEASAALHLARGDSSALLVWGEAGEDVDDAVAGFRILRFHSKKKGKR